MDVLSGGLEASLDFGSPGINKKKCLAYIEEK
jgi:hypothetical protein